MQKLGFAEYWLNQAVPHPNSFSKIVKERIKDQFLQNWSEQLFSSSACSNYRIFKTDFKFEEYFTLLPRDLALSLCNFRCRNNKLPVVIGARYDLSIDQRVCNFCNNNSVGDEFHYVFNCTHFNAERKKYILYNTKTPNTVSFAKLFQSSDYLVLLNLAIFVKKVMQAFKQ